MSRELLLLLAVLTCLNGLVSLLGYWTGQSALYAPIAGAIGMAPNTALGFVTVGLALFVLAHKQP